MLRAVVLLLALCTISAFAQTWTFTVTNNAGKTATVPITGFQRACVCLETTQTNKIKNVNAGVMKLFSTSDCTGNYSVLSKGSTQSNSQWVNSASVGVDGVPSWGPPQCDPWL